MFRHHKALIILLALARTVAAQTVPSTLNYQGRLTDNGTTPAAITATVNMSFEIWDVQSGGTAAPDRLWFEPASGTVPVQVTNGIFSILLGGNGVPVPASLFSGGTTRYLQIIANGETLSPRQTISATGFANQAQNAYASNTAIQATNADYATAAGSASNSAALGAVSAANYQSATNQSCAAGSFLRAISSSGGSATCASANGALTPPLSLNAASASPILSATNSGTGRAGLFTVSNTASSATALAIVQQGTGSAITVNSVNTADASTVVSLSGNGTGSILNVLNSGSGGGGGYFEVSDVSNLAPALIVKTDAPGTGLQAFTGNAGGVPVYINGASGQTANLTEWRNSGGTLLSWLDNVGGFHGNGAALTGVIASGLTLPYSGTDSGTAASAFTVVKSGTAGEAGDFSLNDTLTTSDALHVSNAGRGSAIYANKTNNSGTGAGVRAIASGQNAIYATSTSAAGIYAESTSGIGASGNSSSGRGVLGTSSTNYGVVGQSGTGGSGLANGSYGVAGINTNSGDAGFLGGATLGVYGIGTGGTHVGVYGQAALGATAVQGVISPTDSGYAGYFENGNPSNALPALSVTTLSSSAALNLTAGSPTGTALAIQRGAIQVAGAGVNTTTPAFIHLATVANSSSQSTTITNPMTDGNPNAILIITQNWSVSGVYNPHPVGVYYGGGKWIIFNEDVAAMPVNAAFNVLVIKP